MGFTPLEGLVMATRSGSVDPGLMLWLLERGEVGTQQLAHALEHESGLLGLGGESDMRVLRERDDERALLALGVYTHRLCAAIGAMSASLGGLDALVFTGGVGEHDAALRAQVAAQLAFLGVAVDAEINRAGSADRDISATGAGVHTLVLAAREDLEVARQTRAALSS
jgi:acetate kinase